MNNDANEADALEALQDKVIALQAELGAAKAELLTAYEAGQRVQDELKAALEQVEAMQLATPPPSPPETAPEGTTSPERTRVPKDVAGAANAERRRRRELKLMASSRLIQLIMRFDGRTRADLNKLTRAELEEAVIRGEAKLRAKAGK